MEQILGCAVVFNFVPCVHDAESTNAMLSWQIGFACGAYQAGNATLPCYYHTGSITSTVQYLRTGQ